jgi:hypothetical protein
MVPLPRRFVVNTNPGAVIRLAAKRSILAAKRENNFGSPDLLFSQLDTLYLRRTRAVRGGPIRPHVKVPPPSPSTTSGVPASTWMSCSSGSRTAPDPIRITGACVRDHTTSRAIRHRAPLSSQYEYSLDHGWRWWPQFRFPQDPSLRRLPAANGSSSRVSVSSRLNPPLVALCACVRWEELGRSRARSSSRHR